MPDRPGWRLGVERRLLLSLGALAALALLVIKIAEEVAEQETRAFDRAVLLQFRTPGDLSTPIGPHWLVDAMSQITSLGSPPVLTLVTVAAVGYLLALRRVATASLVALSVISCSLAEKAVKHLFDRPRPDVVPHLVAVHSPSFPSGHAMLSAVTYLTLAALLARGQTQAPARVFVVATGVLLTLLISFTRVYLGVHWPTDVVAGWAAGAIWAMLFWMIANRTG